LLFFATKLHFLKYRVMMHIEQSVA
jgi:hypothetical protein